MTEVLRRDPANRIDAPAVRGLRRCARDGPSPLAGDRRSTWMSKVLRINWPYILLLCALAAVGYIALYSAGGGSPEPFARRHALRFASAW